ncbi:MAG: ECF transporter S component [Candidatus Cloacimonadaceae bacterium]|nr:ECF transporter S component [Candidatus Cloacimonadota bacterium]HQL14765.1 ECF transporter S component [Candidatus Cloacimonadota bacterium]
MQKKSFSTRDLLLICLLAALGLAIKPLVKTLTHLISTPLGIPGGTLGGGFYMMWLSLALAFTKRFGAATLVGLLQGIIVLITGWFGNHGALSLFTYTFPGLAIDLVGLLYKRYTKLDGQIIYCLLANLTGTWLVGIIIMSLPKAPLYIALGMSIISGVIGGALSYLIYKELVVLNLIKEKEEI